MISTQYGMNGMDGITEVCSHFGPTIQREERTSLTLAAVFWNFAFALLSSIQMKQVLCKSRNLLLTLIPSSHFFPSTYIHKSISSCAMLLSSFAPSPSSSLHLKYSAKFHHFSTILGIPSEIDFQVICISICLCRIE